MPSNGIAIGEKMVRPPPWFPLAVSVAIEEEMANIAILDDLNHRTQFDYMVRR